MRILDGRNSRKDKLECFEMWRKMLKWTDEITNEEYLKKAEETRRLCKA